MDSLRGPEIPTYSFVADSGAWYAVYFEVTGSSALLAVWDSVAQSQLLAVYGVAGVSSLAFTVTGSFSRPGVLLLKVNGLNVPAVSHFRFYIYRVNRGPELRAERFAIGDTVSGESLDPSADVDEFYATGQAGQDLVGWIDALGPSPFGFSVFVTDTATGTYLGGGFYQTGPTPQQVFPITPLPATRDYRFTVPFPRQPFDVQSTGPYRFRIYPIDRAPESINATLPMKTTVSGESIDIAGDIDELSVPASGGQEFNVFLKSDAPRIVTLSPLGAEEGGGAVSVGPADAGDIFQHSTGRFKVLVGGDFGLRVNSEYVRDAVGPYEVYVYPVNRAPEVASAAVTVGDTVEGETIELPGDIDEFTFTGIAGQEFNVFLQASDPLPRGVTLSILDPNNALLAGTQSAVVGQPLLALSTGRFNLPASGTYRVAVDGQVSPYRLLVYRVNPLPESAPQSLSLGDSVTAETIDVPGDVDEFTFTVAESSLASLVLEVGSGAPGALVGASVLKSASREPVASIGFLISGAGFSGAFDVAPGSYIVRVENAPYPSPVAAPYKLKSYRFKRSPEIAGENIVVPDTIEVEAIDAPGDVDLYYLDLSAGEHINVAFQGTAPPGANGGLDAFLSRPDNYPLAVVRTALSNGNLDDHQTLRIDLPVTGRYVLSVSGGSSPPLATEVAPYRLAVTHVPSTPEVVSSALTPGDSVTSEPLDPLGDWDQFTVTATPGQDLGLVFQSSAPGPFYPRIMALNPVTGDTLVQTVGQSVRFAGPFSVPSSGQAAIAVFEPSLVGFRECATNTCNGVFQFTGGYKFRVFSINRAPEHVPATYAVGDTVRGEAVDSIGDFDEFTTTAPPGQRLNAYLRATVPPVPAGQGLTLEVIDPATGAALAGSNIQILGQQFVAVGSFTVPSSGNLLIRVRGTGTFGDDITTGPYEFVIKP